MIGGRCRRFGRILRGMTVPTRRAAAEENVLGLAVTWSRRIVIATVLGTVVMAALLPAALASTLALLLVGAGLVAGLPHGSVDHLLASRLTGRSPVGVTVAYAVAAVLAWVLLSAAGPVALGAVVALSVLHFGLGEVQVHTRTTGWRPHRVVATALAIAGTGALLLPLARSGEQMQGVAAAISPAVADVVGADPTRLALAALWIGAAGVAGVAALRAGKPMVAVDIVLVGVLGAVAPPLVAFAVWFGGWHALRHTGRLLIIEPGCAALISAGRPRDAVRRLAQLAAWPSAAAVAVLAAVVAFTVTAPDLEVAIAEILRLLLALTVPHMLIVLWLDRRGLGPV